jgi:hypothetical protein
MRTWLFSHGRIIVQGIIQFLNVDAVLQFGTSFQLLPNRSLSRQRSTHAMKDETMWLDSSGAFIILVLGDVPSAPHSKWLVDPSILHNISVEHCCN